MLLENNVIYRYYRQTLFIRKYDYCLFTKILFYDKQFFEDTIHNLIIMLFGWTCERYEE